MPIASTNEYSEMLDTASTGGYALPAVNVTSSETLNAAMRGFAEAGSDGIVQVTTGAADFLSGGSGDLATGARALAEYAHIVGEQLPVLVGLHTDHATPDKFDSFVGPLVIWLMKKDTMPFVADQAKEALNFNITVSAVFLVLLILSLMTLGLGFLVTLPVMLIVGIAALVFVIIAAMKANQGIAYRYPMTVRLVK